MAKTEEKEGTESLSPICARCYEMTSLALRRHGGMPPMTGVLEWKDVGPLGRTGWGHEEGALPSLSRSSK